jgi:hypothetical protein
MTELEPSDYSEDFWKCLAQNDSNCILPHLSRDLRLLVHHLVETLEVPRLLVLQHLLALTSTLSSQTTVRYKVL